MSEQFKIAGEPTGDVGSKAIITYLKQFPKALVVTSPPPGQVECTLELPKQCVWCSKTSDFHATDLLPCRHEMHYACFHQFSLQKIKLWNVRIEARSMAPGSRIGAISCPSCGVVTTEVRHRRSEPLRCRTRVANWVKKSFSKLFRGGRSERKNLQPAISGHNLVDSDMSVHSSTKTEVAEASSTNQPDDLSGGPSGNEPDRSPGNGQDPPQGGNPGRSSQQDQYQSPPESDDRQTSNQRGAPKFGVINGCEPPRMHVANETVSDAPHTRVASHVYTENSQTVSGPREQPVGHAYVDCLPAGPLVLDRPGAEAPNKQLLADTYSENTQLTGRPQTSCVDSQSSDRVSLTGAQISDNVHNAKKDVHLTSGSQGQLQLRWCSRELVSHSHASVYSLNTESQSSRMTQSSNSESHNGQAWSSAGEPPSDSESTSFDNQPRKSAKSLSSACQSQVKPQRSENIKYPRAGYQPMRSFRYVADSRLFPGLCREGPQSLMLLSQWALEL